MLVLTRRVNERIRINDDIRIVVVRIGQSQVRIGFEAPTDKYTVLREEVYLRGEDHKCQSQSHLKQKLPKKS